MLAGALGAAAGIGLAIYFANAGDDAVVASPTASVSDVSPSASPSVSPTATAGPTVIPGEIIATVTTESVDVFDAAGDAEPSATLTEWSLYGQVRTLLAVDDQTVDGTRWLQVLLPLQPNGSTGWIKADDVELSSTTISIHVFLDERELELRDGDEVLLTTPVVIGDPETPTPLGLASVTDPLDFQSNPTGVYGAYAIGLSSFSEVLETFDGGPPQIAIHGTNEPDLMGQAVSNGCIRVPNEAAIEIAATAGLGTPVTVEQSRS